METNPNLESASQDAESLILARCLNYILRIGERASDDHEEAAETMNVTAFSGSDQGDQADPTPQFKTDFEASKDDTDMEANDSQPGEE